MCAMPACRADLGELMGWRNIVMKPVLCAMYHHRHSCFIDVECAVRKRFGCHDLPSSQMPELRSCAATGSPPLREMWRCDANTQPMGATDRRRGSDPAAGIGDLSGADGAGVNP